MKLRSRDRLAQIYHDLGNDLDGFLILYERMKEAGKTPSDAILISNNINQLASLRYSCNEKSRELLGLQSTAQSLALNCQQLMGQQHTLEYNISTLLNQHQNLNAANQYLAGQQSQLQSSIDYIRNLAPKLILDIAGGQIQSVLARRREMLSVAIGAVFQTILADPQNMVLINAMSGMPINNPLIQEELTMCRNEFLNLAEKAYQNLSFQCAKGIVDYILNNRLVPRLHYPLS